MSWQVLKLASIWFFLISVCVFSAIDAARAQSSRIGIGSSGRQVIFLLDINPHQKKVLGVELAVAEGILEKLRDPRNSFSIITFGSKPPTFVRRGVDADEAITAVRGVSLEETKEKYFGVYFYDALELAMDEFAWDTRQKSIVVISEGNDYFLGNTLKETVSRMQQSQILCHAIMIASHSFYGTKGIQRYGFDLRRLVNKTRGQYVEVESSRKKVPQAADRIAENIDREP